MTILDTPASMLIVPLAFLFPGKRQLIPRGMEPWEPDGCDDGEVDDLRDDPDGAGDEQPEGPESAS